MTRSTPKHENTPFYKHFATVYGARWPALYEAMQAPVQHVAWRHPHSAADAPDYFLDAASLWVARALPIPSEAKIIDLCAAPGGKSLVLSEHLLKGLSLTSNELSKARRERLRKVIKDHVPHELQSQIRILGHDASRWCLYEKNMYDAVLLDAPCSSERHLIHNPKLIQEWSAKRSRFLGQRQYALLASAMQIAKPGAHVLYATCSISPEENEAVIQKLFKKGKIACEEVELKLEHIEKKAHGYQILPDRSQHGPMYLCLLRRIV